MHYCMVGRTSKHHHPAVFNQRLPLTITCAHACHHHHHHHHCTAIRRYHSLITTATELVGALESSVRGIPINPGQLLTICTKLNGYATAPIADILRPALFKPSHPHSRIGCLSTRLETLAGFQARPFAYTYSRINTESARVGCRAWMPRCVAHLPPLCPVLPMSPCSHGTGEGDESFDGGAGNTSLIDNM